jgi:hypothetical protein
MSQRVAIAQTVIFMRKAIAVYGKPMYRQIIIATDGQCKIKIELRVLHLQLL